MNNENRKIGLKGEKIAQKYLEGRGYKIIETNFYCRFGEVDIIAQFNEELIFCEVKTRKQIKYGKAAESVNYSKQKHIYKVAEFYTYLYRLYDLPISLDVIEVYIFEDKKTRVEHIKNAIIENPYKTFVNRW